MFVLFFVFLSITVLAKDVNGFFDNSSGGDPDFEEVYRLVKMRVNVEELRASRLNLNATSGDGISVLHVLIFENDFKGSELLIKAGASINLEVEGSSSFWTSKKGKTFNAFLNPELLISEKNQISPLSQAFKECGNSLKSQTQGNKKTL